MRIVAVDSENSQIYLHLCQSYEGEFSALTAKKPNAQGLFELDTPLGGAVLGYLLYAQQAPIGLAAVKVHVAGALYEVCEFYIVPSCRKQGLGQWFASELFKRYKGQWEVKQLRGADAASTFWRKTIGAFTGGAFQEELYHDAYWGEVVRQQFVSA